METLPSRLGYFLLVRLAASGNAPTRLALDSALKPFFCLRLGLSDGRWRQLLDQTLEELSAGQWIETRPYKLTPKGRDAVKMFLQVEDLPTDCKWQALRNQYLIARALEIPHFTPAQLKRLGSTDGLRAAVLVKHFKLPIEPLPTLRHALDALAEHVLRPNPTWDLSQLKPAERDEKLRQALIPEQPGELKACLPAAITKAQNNSVESLRLAVIIRWLNGSDESEYAFLNAETASEVHTESESDLTEFARWIRELARNAATGHFGENKVFLSQIWESYRQESATNMSRAEFDRQLVEANRRNLIQLSRADLISEMNPADVEASEISLPHATFHFIRTDIDPKETCDHL